MASFCEVRRLDTHDMKQSLVPFIALVICIAVVGSVRSVRAQTAPSSQTRIADRDFWTMLQQFSEPGGSFVSDNIISNEIAFQQVIPEVARNPERGAYIGVGPEQNFTYIAAFRPAVAFIIDFQRQNLLLHLMYKALIESSADRVEFMSLLFARPRPAMVDRDPSARLLFERFMAIPVSQPLAETTIELILARLKRTHGFPLSGEDEHGIRTAYRSLYEGGPGIRGDFGGGSWIPSYLQLMTQTDLAGRDHAYLASDGAFVTLKRYETNNLIVPVVGDFGGTQAFRSVAHYLVEHGLTISTLYTSNVEDYLFRGNGWHAFYNNVAALPHTRNSAIIRTFFTRTDEGLRTLLDSIDGTLTAVREGQVRYYKDIVSRSRAATNP